jgi:putative DNA primase/helicase
MTAADLSCHISDIARRLLGPPNDRLSTRHQLRFGTNGSVCVEIDGPKRGSWFDHENSCGGGPWDLLRLKGNLVNGAATDWLAKEIGVQVGGRGGLNIVATYDYRDEQGNLLFQQCRLEPKSFRQRRPDGSSGWVWKTQGVRKVLYCLPELLAAPPGAIVFVVEGEKDVDNLRRNDLVATCNPGCRQAWR